MIREFVSLSHAMVPERSNIEIEISRNSKFKCRKKPKMYLTFKAAADGSSGSPKNGFVFSILRLFVCLVRTSPILNTIGVDISEKKK